VVPTISFRLIYGLLILRHDRRQILWDRLKELVEAYQDADARHQAFVELIAPAVRNVHAYWLARRAPARDTIDDTRRPIHKVLVPGRNDPCLCGSGKKFKHCHGALKLLH
jgi:uncharacterized protein